MGKCPYCGEAIKAEAKICRHCDRSVTYDLYFNSQDSDREIYSFFRDWPEATKDIANRILFGSLKEIKDLAKKTELLVAFELTEKESAKLVKQFNLMKRLHETSASGMSTDFSDSRPSLIPALFYASLALITLGVAGFLFFNPNQLPGIASLIQESSPISDPQTPSDFNFQMSPPPQDLNQIPSNQLQNSMDRSGSANSSGQLTREEMLHLLRSSVFIVGEGNLGSGFFISSDGYILSNAHVTSPMSRPRIILQNGKELQAEKVREDPRLDISLLKVNVSNAAFLELGDANQLYPGQDVITIGNPSGYSFTVTRGIVSFVGRNLGGVKFIQTDAAINPGNSGGPMVVAGLKVVGINSRKASQEEGISFALPINYAYSNGGLARSIGRYPSQAPSFQGSSETMAPTVASFSPGSTPNHTPDLPMDVYQKEAAALTERYQTDLQSWKDSHERLKTEFKKLNEELANSPSHFSRIEEIKREIDRTKDKENQLKEDLKTLQKRHIDRLISLYQRWKVDSRFLSQSASFDEQIQKLQMQKKQIEANL